MSTVTLINNDITECGRKNSPILEANKLKIKEDMANRFLFLERTRIAVLD